MMHSSSSSLLQQHGSNGRRAAAAMGPRTAPASRTHHHAAAAAATVAVRPHRRRCRTGRGSECKAQAPQQADTSSSQFRQAGPPTPPPDYSAIDAAPLNRAVMALFRAKMVAALGSDSEQEGCVFLDDELLMCFGDMPLCVCYKNHQPNTQPTKKTATRPSSTSRAASTAASPRRARRKSRRAAY